MASIYIQAHWSPDKMAVILQTTFSNIFLNEIIWISIKMSLHFAPKRPINTTSPLVQIMAWCRVGDKPLFESMLTRFTDAFMCRVAWMR